MKVKNIDLSPERKMIINMIVSDQFCKNIIPLIDPKFLEPYARAVSSWIIEYYNQFKKAPNKDIKSLYISKKKTLDEDLSESISLFLSSLSKEYEDIEINNIDYELTNAEKFLALRSLEFTKNAIEDALNENNVIKGEQAISSFKRVAQPIGQGVSVLRDTEKVIDAFDESEDYLFSFPGAFGKVAGTFNRGDFLSFLAPMKRGKTWYLLFTAGTAVYFHLKVAFFSFEMTEKQMIRRTYRHFVRQPKKDMEIEIPYFEKVGDKYKIKTKKEFKKGIDISKVKKFQKLFKSKFRQGNMKLISIPSHSATVEDIDCILDNLAFYENYIPDVVIIDYADLIAPPKGTKEYRHQLNHIWMNLRRIAQERNILMVTASQTNKKTFKKDVDEDDAAEDQRKIAHITSGLALNASNIEKEHGIMRIKQVVVREEKQTFDQAVLLQCLDIGSPCIESKMRNEVIFDLNEKDNKQDHSNEYTREE